MEEADPKGTDFDLDELIRQAEETLRTAGEADGRWLGALADLYERRWRQRQLREDFERAISLYRQALLDGSLNREDQASITNDLGEALRQWHLANTSPRDLDEAISLFRQAAEASSEPGFRMNLANGLRDRYHLNNSPGDLDEAIEAYEEAAAALPLDSGYRSLVLDGLGCGLRDRHHADARRHDDLDRSIESLKLAVDLCPPGHPGLVRYLSHLGVALEDRYASTSQLADLKSAIDLHERAVAMAETGHPHRAEALNNLGNALRNLGARTGNTARRREILDRAAGLLNESILVSPPGAVELPSRWNNLGNVLRDLFVLTGDEEDLTAASAAFRKALASNHVDLDQAAIRHNLANALVTLDRSKGTKQWTTEAIELYRASLEETPENSPEYPVRTTNLGLSLLDRAGDEQSPEAVEDRCGGLALLRRAAAAVETAPEVALNAASHWQRRALLGQEWGEVLAAHGSVCVARDWVFRAQSEREEKEAWLRESQGLAAAAAYAAARLGDLRNAVTTLERGLARLLAERFTASGVGIDNSVSFEEIRQLAVDSPLIYLAATRLGGMALIVRAGEPDVEVLWLPGLDETTLLASLQEHFRVYGGWRSAPRDRALRGAWLLSLENLTSWIRSVALEEILRSLGPVAHAYFICAGVLGFLPWHAVEGCLPSNSPVLSYAPSAGGLAAARSVRRAGPPSVLAVSSRLDDQDGDSGTHLDAQIAGAWVERRLLLEGDEASLPAVLAALPRFGILHFACHGSVEAEEPLESGLLLNGGERITLRDFLNLRLEGDLVVLSACESGISGLIVPDESISLPTGLLHAGAAGVIASLWAVDDDATVHLMTRFYDLWTTGAEAPAMALAAAQTWLRETTNKEKLDYVESLGQREERRPPDEVLDTLWTDLRMRQAEQFDFEHVHYWGGFCYIGA